MAELYRDMIGEAGQKKQWGVTTFWNIKKKEDEIKAGKFIPLSSKKRVQEFLESHLVITGPLNATKVLFELNVEDQCKFFEKFPLCETLILQNWKNPISDLTLRTISMTMSDHLLELDMSFSSVDTATLDVILLHFTRLRTAKFSHCPKLDGLAMGLMAKLNGNTVKELFVDHCEQFKLEPLLALSGQIGVASGGLKKLQVLDLGYCPADDRGLIGIGKGCHKLRFLNLQECREVTDAGVLGIIEGNSNLQLLSLAGCALITNKTLKGIGKCCPHLTSVNFSLCVKVTNEGIKAVARNCPNLQVCNFAGILKLSEGSLVELASNCPGLLMLNITGCEAVTPNGLKALISGLKYVEPGITFTGFKPKDKHVEQKLMDHMSFLRGHAIEIIKDGFEKHRLRKEARIQAELDRMERAATVIQQTYRRYGHRQFWYRIFFVKKQAKCATIIQSLWRGMKGRRRAYVVGTARRLFYSRTPQAVQIQRIVRGFSVRNANLHVTRAIVLMYSQRWQEAQVAMYIRLQAFGRRFLVHSKVRILRELRSRRRLDEKYCAIIIQTNTRALLARLLVMRMRYDAFLILKMRTRAARVIANWYHRAINRIRSFLDGTDMISCVRKLKRQLFLMMRVVRGFLGREKAARMRIVLATRTFAATLIQRIYRGSRVLHWRDMRMNVIAAYILDRHNIERDDRVYDSRITYHRFIVENRKDSASEDDEKLLEIEKDVMSSFNWVKSYDYRRMCDFWTNLVDGEQVYEEPFLPFTHERSILNFRCRVYWPVQREWYEGVIWRFNLRKLRHKIIYDDGDYEWMDVRREEDRFQIQREDGSWIMYSLYQSPEMERIRGVIKRTEAGEEDRKKSYEDANQWKLLKSDKGTFLPGESKRVVFFISERTGIIRAGVDDADDWEIQDDGHGYPRFYNAVTKQKVYDDPRFEDEDSKEMETLRDYCLDQMRFTMYFCKELWESYCATKQAYEEETAKLWERIYERMTELGLDPNTAHEYDPAVLLGELEEEDDEPYRPEGAPNPALHPHLNPKKPKVKRPHPGLKLRAVNGVLARIKKSPKPKQLSALVMMAKGLHKTLSVVDKPISKKANAEIHYGQFLAERLAVVQEEAFHTMMKYHDQMKVTVAKLTENSGKPLYCRFCKYETKPHLDFCATCGRRQAYFLKEKPSMTEKLVSEKSKLVDAEDEDLEGMQESSERNYDMGNDMMMLTNFDGDKVPNKVESVIAAAEEVLGNFYSGDTSGKEDLILPPTLQHQFEEEA